MAHFALCCSRQVPSRLVLAVAFFLASSSAFAYQYPLRILREPKGSAVQLSISNEGPAPVNVVIELTSSTNTGFSPAVIGSKYPHLVMPGQIKKITTAVPLKMGRDARFAFRYRFAFGDPQALHKSEQIYRLPIPDDVRGVVRAYTGPYITGTFVDTANAAEIVLPLGTPVVASREGVVINGKGFVGETDSASHSPIGNFVSILHDDGTWATYGWLADHSVLPLPGTRVKSGDVIAKSDRNPDAVETYIMFAVNRNYYALNLKSVPLKLVAAGSQVIEPSTFTGQVSPTLPPKYKRTDDDTPWVPSETLVPLPQPPIDWDDEHLSPTQRQVLFRQRLLEASDASDSVAGSRPLILLAITGALLGSLGAFVAFSTHGSARPSGVRGFVWTLFRGRSPTGSVPATAISDDGTYSIGPSTDLSLTLPPEQTPGVSTVSPQADIPEPSSPIASADPDVVSSDHDPDESDVHKPKQLMHPDRVKLFSAVSAALPSGYVCTPHILLRDLVDSALPFDAQDLIVDFVIVEIDTGLPKAAIIYVPPGADAEASMLLSQRLSIAAVPTATFDSTPKHSEIKARLKRLI